VKARDSIMQSYLSNAIGVLELPWSLQDQRAEPL
jgi:hypothetical protein